ncbi:MAG: T9SS type A sorting domain-containing protein [Chitinophagales bacterium]|nr:T9SS type A sorting domain-containing protein [Chitinophagales bacterium]MCB9019612.1 T9SS type A sorting domain-containing protein [Chitinophagales bacterium]MCB9022814.1 T9SS type A sorting domain-containing protein [Chitinophagales bacterium]HPE97542.1 pre-peptidase C-terminal domain-containing protein [Chitinophagales bacterium]HQU39386.1 pre-peptidase C-terminal domain-containing protein [Chitinophagales bacterium]
MRLPILLSAILIAAPILSYATTIAETESNNTSGTANAVAVNDSVTGSVLGADLDFDWFSFTTAEDGIIRINYAITGSGHANIYLLDNDGTTILSSATVVPAGTTASFQYNKAAAGDYFMRIQYYSAATDCSYELVPEVITNGYGQDAEPNDVYTDALVLAENSSADGHLGYRYNGGALDQIDWYQVTTTEDGNLNVTLDIEPSSYFNLSIYDSNGVTSLGSASASDLVSVTRNGVAAGVYYIRVHYYSTTYYGGYTLTNSLTSTGIPNDAEPNDVSTQALVLPENGSTQGHIGYRYNGGSYDEDDWYELTTTSDGDVTVSLAYSVGMYHRLYLYAADGVTNLASTGGYDSISVTKAGLAAGTFLVRVEHYSTTYYSPYTLYNAVAMTEYDNDAEPNDVYTDAMVMDENSTMYGHIGHRYDVGGFDEDDWYQVVTTQDGTLTITAENNTGQYHTLTLYDSNGTTSLGSNSAYTTQTVVRKGLAAGTYYIRMSHYSTTYFSGYSLTNLVTPPAEANDMEDNDSIPVAQPMLTNSSAEGHIGFRYNGATYDEYDYYELVLNQPGDLSATLTFDPVMYHRLYLKSSSGTNLDSDEAYGECQVSETGLDAGTYYILVEHYSTTYHSGYTLTNNYCPDTVVIMAEGITTFCEGESVLLFTEDHHLSYLWSDGSTTETNAADITGGYSLTIDNGDGCVRTSNIVDIEVEPNPLAVIDLDGPAEFCEGGSVTLSISSDAPDAYLWSTGESTPTIEVTTSGDYSVELFKGTCSAISDPVAITVWENPVASVTPLSATTLCEGEAVTLDAGAASEYLWSTGETTSSIDVDATGSYSVTITDVNGCTDISNAVDVTVNPIPVATITPDGPTEFCEDGSVLLTASAGDSYLWSTGETTASISASAAGSYNVEVTTLGCSATSSDVNVTVYAAPVASISADGPTTFCDGESVTLTASAGDSYLWSTGETTSSIVVSETGSYTVTVYTAEGCDNTSAAADVMVNICTEELVISADGPVEFCEGGSVTLTANLAEGNLWSTGETTVSIVVSTSGDYYCENGEQTSNTITVTVNPLPVAEITADGPTELCEGETVNLTASGGDFYLWSTLESTAGIEVGAGSYSVTVTSTEGCESNAGPVVVTESVSPVVEVLSPLMEKLCYEGATTLEVSASGGDIQWYRNGVELAGATSTAYIADMPGLYTCVADNGICPAVVSEDILVGVVLPFNLITTGVIYICDGDLTTLEAPYSPTASYQWYQNNVAIPGANSSTYDAGTTGKYHVVLTQDGCARRSSFVYVKVNCRLAANAVWEMDLYPNPASENAYIQIGSSDNTTAELLIANIQGELVYREVIQISEGNQIVSLPVSNMAAGVYMVSLVSENGLMQNEQLIIQH